MDREKGRDTDAEEHVGLCVKDVDEGRRAAEAPLLASRGLGSRERPHGETERVHEDGQREDEAPEAPEKIGVVDEWERERRPPPVTIETREEVPDGKWQSHRVCGEEHSRREERVE